MRFLKILFILSLCVVSVNAGIKYAPSMPVDNVSDIKTGVKCQTEKFDKYEGLSTSAISHDTITLPPVKRSKGKKLILKRANSLDSLYARRANGTLILPDAPEVKRTDLSGLSFGDTIIINPLYLPIVFNGKMLSENLSFYPPKKDYKYKGTLLSPNRTFIPMLQNMDFVDSVRLYYYVQYPDRIKMSVFTFNGLPKVSVTKDVLETFDPFKKPISVENTASLEAPDVDTVEIKRKYWLFSGEHKLQFSQNYFSNNWYKGGASFMNINNYHILRANYKKEKVKFENILEWRLSLSTAPNDSLRKYRVGDDMVRYYGSMGIDAFLKHWSYSINLELKSQIFNNYKPNDPKLLSAFLAPAYANAGIGMRYVLKEKSKKVRHRKIELILDMAPISMNYVYVGNNAVDVKRYGILNGKHMKMEFGSTINSTLKYNITKYITWDSRLKYFTSYKNILAEFENTLDMKLNNYFSTTFYVYMRFDDGVPEDAIFKHLQINEMLSFGLNYKW